MKPTTASLELDDTSSHSIVHVSNQRRVRCKWSARIVAAGALIIASVCFHYLRKAGSVKYNSNLDHDRFMDIASRRGSHDYNSPKLSPSVVNSNVSTFDCTSVELIAPGGVAIPLKTRDAPARLIDAFAYAFPEEYEELLLRFYEMGDVLDEIHVVEGDRDFMGGMKDLTFEAVLASRQDLHRWREKITYHPVNIPEGVKGYALQDYQRQAMFKRIENRYGPRNVVLLESDLDEITSRHLLYAIRSCQPHDETIDWNAQLEERLFVYSMAWTTGLWTLPAIARFLVPPKSNEILSESRRLYFDKAPNTIRSKVGPSGWHVGWTLDGAKGLAHKIFIHIEGRPSWAAGYSSEASLAEFLQNDFLPAPNRYDHDISPSKLSKADVPQALVLEPEKFPNIMRGVDLKS